VKKNTQLACFLILLFFAFVNAQQKRIAIINTVDDEEPPVEISDLNYLTDRLREIAGKILAQESYAVMTQQSIVDLLGSPEAVAKKCRESSCLVQLGREVKAHYVGQGRIGRFDGNLTIKVELYNSANSMLVSSFTGISKDMPGLLSALDKEAPYMFRNLSGVFSPVKSASNLPASSAILLADERDGKRYGIIRIGNQIQMAENLNYDTAGSKCYDGKLENCIKHGRLYNLETAKKVCPYGWHLPDSTRFSADDGYGYVRCVKD